MTPCRALLLLLIALLGTPMEALAAEPAAIERLVRARADGVAQMQDSHLRELKELARLPVIRDYFLASESQRPARLRQVQAALAGRDLGAELCLIDQHGSEHLRAVHGHLAPSAQLAHNETEAPFFAEGIRLAAGELHLSQPYASPDIREWVLGYVVAVIPGKAILHFEHPLKDIQAQAVQDVSGPDRIVLVVDRNGIVFGDSRRSVSLSTTGDSTDAAANFASIADGPERLPAAIVDAVTTEPERSITITWQGRRWDAAWQRVGPLTLIGLQHVP